MADMYLYNGVKLPALPESMTGLTNYPLLLIYTTSAGVYRLIAVTGISYTDSTTIHFTDPNRYICDLADDGSSWEDSIRMSVATLSFIDYPVVWTNTDIPDDSGGVLLPASDPVPVGVVPALDQKSLMLGWLMGRKIAKQRGKTKTGSTYLTC